jgi:hypothetical protein
MNAQMQRDSESAQLGHVQQWCENIATKLIVHEQLPARGFAPLLAAQIEVEHARHDICDGRMPCACACEGNEIEHGFGM